MDAKLSQLFTVVARVASDAVGTPASENARRLLFDVFPHALLVLARGDDVAAHFSDFAGRGAHASGLKARAVVHVLRKEVAKLTERVNTGLHTLQTVVAGGTGTRTSAEAGGLVREALLLIAQKLSVLDDDLVEAARTLGEGPLDDGADEATGASDAAFQSSKGSSAATDRSGARAAGPQRPSVGSFGRKSPKEGAARPSASEQMRKRDERKQRVEAKRVVRETIAAAGSGALGGAAVSQGGGDGHDEEAGALIDGLFATAARLRAGSLPWAAKVLAIPVTADRERARRQYRQRARLFHPDVCADARAHEAFALVQRAWDVFESYVEGQTKQA